MAMLVLSLLFMPSIPRRRDFAFIVITSEPMVGHDRLVFLVLYNIHKSVAFHCTSFRVYGYFEKVERVARFRSAFQSRTSCK